MTERLYVKEVHPVDLTTRLAGVSMATTASKLPVANDLIHVQVWFGLSFGGSVLTAFFICVHCHRNCLGFLERLPSIPTATLPDPSPLLAARYTSLA